MGNPLLWRILPLHLYARRSHVLLERSLRAYRRSWYVVLSGFFEPVFYLLALGQGVGALVGDVQTANGPVGYAAFIAPGLLATSAMNGAIYDATTNVFFKLRYAKLYDTMLATSLGPVDVAVGEVTWSLIRGGLYSLGFVGVISALGLAADWTVLLAVPAALLIAAGFAAVGMAVTSFARSFQHLEWINAALLPMFLFSTTFFPLDVYPRAVQILVEVFPLYHGIELMRGLTLGELHVGLLWHALYFVGMALIGVVVVTRRLDKLLLR
ncbi:ABC transporter [Nakamurella sp. YIM 132087]|uniref:Transport permease protein n=1 Tax=Nakamurella alba TaxID=2665158 RepID=A0A7K1FG92_9ACTN|nr:ABC transporter [Nakamurella alba]